MCEIIKSCSKPVRIHPSPAQDDIKSYPEMKLDHDTNPYALDDELRADIMRAIREMISEM